MSGPIVLNGRVTLRERRTGVDQLAREIISRLVAMRPELYRLLRPAGGDGGRRQQGWEQVTLPLAAARLRAPLIYSPANLAPLAWPRNVLVLHDAGVWRTPDSYSAAYRAWHRFAEAAGARRARHVVTVSEFSRRELVEVLGVDPRKVTVIPCGVSDRFTPAADAEPARRRHGLERPYVLSVVSGQARKNLAALEALGRRLAAEGVEVAVAGSGLPPSAATRVLGYVPDEDLPGLYAGAEAFVFPSRYEGFGIPPIEAMASGTPVVASDRAALPEACGGAALLVDPDDEPAVTAAVLHVLEDGALRARLREAGLRRAAELSWERAAAATDRLLRRLAAASRP